MLKKSLLMLSLVISASFLASEKNPFEGFEKEFESFNKTAEKIYWKKGSTFKASNGDTYVATPQGTYSKSYINQQQQMQQAEQYMKMKEQGNYQNGCILN
jgi:hypothetical protein